MKSIFRLTVLLAALLVIFNSCSKTNNELKMIPSNALLVLQLNTRSLMSKVSWDDIKQTNWYKQLYNDTAVKTWTKKLMDNPTGTGIDLTEALLVFMQKDENSNQEVVFEGTIKDVNAFEAFNKNLDEKATAVKEGDITMLTLKNETVVGWNDKKFAYIFNSSRFIPKADDNNGDDTLPGNRQAVSDISALSIACKKLFVLTTDSSMAKNDKFSNLLKEEGDVHLWQNNEELVKNSVQMGMLSMLKIDALLKGNITTATASFDNGKINVKQKFYTSPELTSLLKKYNGSKINTDMIKSIPSKNVTGLFVLNYQPEGLKEIIKLIGVDGFLNMFLSQKGITMDDFVKANKGDLLFAVTDFMMKKDSFNFNSLALKDTSYSYDKPSANYLFSVSIGDKPSFDKLMAAGKKIGGDLSDAGIYFINNDKIFAVGNPQQYVSKYLTGSNNTYDFTDRISGHPIALFVDIQKILLPFSSGPLMKDSSNKTILDESLKIWQNIYSTGGEFKDDAFIMNTEINFVNKDTNSLKQLNNYLDRISKVLIEKKKKYQETFTQADSLTTYPPMSNMDTLPANH